MSRTRKGSKGPGWEPWSNRHEKALQRAEYREPGDFDEDFSPCTCPACECRKCGGWFVKGIEGMDRPEIPFTCHRCGEISTEDCLSE